jgi:hypothetical protein
VDYTVTTNFASAGYKTCIQYSAASTASASYAELSGGRFGGVALRDIKPVMNTDGTTYQPGSNTVYFTATASDPQGTASAGVFTLNLATQAITETGVVCVARTFSAVAHTYCSDDGLNVIYHGNGDREDLIDTWSTGFSNTNPVQILYKYVASGGGDILTTNLTVLSSMTALSPPLGSAGLGAYDQALAYDTVNSRYALAYSICNDCTFVSSSLTPSFYPALAYASSQTGTYTLTGMDNALAGGWEGTNLINVQGTLYLMTGGMHSPWVSTLAACNNTRVYDMSFTLLGQLSGATLGNTPSTTNAPCPHPSLFQHPDGLHMVLFTFNDVEWTSGQVFTTGQPQIELSTP